MPPPASPCRADRFDRVNRKTNPAIPLRRTNRPGPVCRSRPATIPKQTEWWPWQVQGLALEPSAATEWLSRLPLSGRHPDLAEELRWWSHLQRWALSLVARGRWIPQVELSKGEGYPHRARWVPLLNREEDRRRLEDLAASLPLVATCALPWREPMGRRSNRMTRLRPEAMRAANPVACCRPRSGRLRVATLLEDLVDALCARTFSPISMP